MIDITGMAHVGVRVADFGSSVRFYEDMGFRVVREDQQEHVVVLVHPAGVELNLLDSASNDNNGNNILMDEPVRYPGYTHIALRVADIRRTEAALRSSGITITEGPVTFGDGSTSVFFRDPDRNVIELTRQDEIARARR
jgi:lactoylglutathione lyase